MFRGKTGFVTGFVAAAMLCGTAVVFSAIGLYTPSPDGDWIRDGTKYQPGTDDQINVLGDIAPGGGVIMQEVGLRLNALNAAGKKQNWDFAEYQSTELEEAIDRLATTRPELASGLESFITARITPVNAAIAAADKGAFLTAIGDMTDACTACHVTFDKPFLVVKVGKSALPIK